MQYQVEGRQRAIGAWQVIVGYIEFVAMPDIYRPLGGLLQVQLATVGARRTIDI
jgi:energy-converting hydrogenase Eha subunit E